MTKYQFIKHYLLLNKYSYLFAVTCIFIVNWLLVEIPRYIQQAIDLLNVAPNTTPNLLVDNVQAVICLSLLMILIGGHDKSIPLIEIHQSNDSNKSLSDHNTNNNNKNKSVYVSDSDHAMDLDDDIRSIAPSKTTNNKNLGWGKPQKSKRIFSFFKWNLINENENNA